MKYVYIILILGLSVSLYYVCYDKQTEEIDHLTAVKSKDIRIQKGLTKDVADLQTVKDKLTKDDADVKKLEDGLNTDISGLQQNIDNDGTETTTANTAATEARAAAETARKHTDSLLNPPAPVNNLGTIVTENGKTYENCTLLKVEATSITISSLTGVVQIYYPFLPVELQEKFGYDRMHPADLSPTQVNYQEAIRLQLGNSVDANGSH